MNSPILKTAFNDIVEQEKKLEAAKLLYANLCTGIQKRWKKERSSKNDFWWFFANSERLHGLPRNLGASIGAMTTGNGISVPFYQQYGMGEYTNGLSVINGDDGDRMVEYRPDVLREPIPEYRERVIEEEIRIIAALHEISANGIVVHLHIAPGYEIAVGQPLPDAEQWRVLREQWRAAYEKEYEAKRAIWRENDRKRLEEKSKES